MKVDKHYRALLHPDLCGPLLAGESWRPWRAVLAAIFGVVPDDPEDRDLVLRVTGRTKCPTTTARAVWIVGGRRLGKSWVSALLMSVFACLFDGRLAPGERAVVVAMAADRKQAGVLMGYVKAIIQTVPSFAAMVDSETQGAIVLRNGVTVEVHTASYRTVRGRTVLLCVADELAFWRTETDSSNPDKAILEAVRPSMATIPGALLVCVSTPYAKRGELWRAYSTHFGKNGADELVIRASSRTLNPSIPTAVIDRAYADDPASASAEFGAEFRTDISGFVSREAAEACVMPDRHELPPVSAVRYHAFCDPSGGASDSMTLAIGHKDGGRVVVDCIREQTAPFDPDSTVAAFAQTLRTYHLHTVVGDKYAGAWPHSRFRAFGITCQPVDKTKSELYQALLPMLNSHRIELLDLPRLLSQLTGLERRTARSGKDSIDHAPRQHDDVANVVAGLVQVITKAASSGPLVACVQVADPRPKPSFALLASRRAKRRQEQADQERDQHRAN